MTLTAEPKSGRPLARAIPDRFRTSGVTLWLDRFMNRFIKIGGVAVIAAVFGIFLFIFLQILPLFRSAEVTFIRTLDLPDTAYRQMGIDEWGELPFVVDADGTLTFFNSETGALVKTFTPELPEGASISALRYSGKEQELYLGTSDGALAILRINYNPVFKDGVRTIVAEPERGPMIQIAPGHPVRALDYKDAGAHKLVGAIVASGDMRKIMAVTLTQKRTLFGAGETEIGQIYDLSDEAYDGPEKILVGTHADSLTVASASGRVSFFHLKDGQFTLRQQFTPFNDVPARAIASMDFIFGGVSIVFTNPAGLCRVYSLYVPEEGAGDRVFGLTKHFERLPSGASFFHASVRNKGFLIGSGSYVSLRYGTTETVRWSGTLPFNVQSGLIGSKYDSLYLLDDAGKLHMYALRDNHPEAGYKAFFGKLWYEGYAKPAYAWQSTGGTDDFEPKLSLVPLIFGTLKGTFYSMMFALPIALLAALYTSQFAHPSVRNLIKPVMEIMAALPSVVLGFLAALWLAPVVEDRVPSLILIIILIPVFAFFMGWLWTRLPRRQRTMIRPGYEWLISIPVFLLLCMLSWHLGPVLERILFVVTDPDTGVRVADFRMWWQYVVGAPFEQRNSLVVGFVMGFAVIPIIFTIAEDSLSNVPAALRAGSLALGASRWQTTYRVILPTAFPGVFSATMIGFGRAVGETMIVVMATGNTPIMNMNIFNGFRTLSANIAVELPEAPYLGTLYRTLFLGALVLFMLTFMVNTAAEIIRQRLREKYKMA